MLHLLDHDGALFVLAPLVLKPDPDHPGGQACHLDELLLHQGVRPRVSSIAGPQGVELLLVEHGSHPGRLVFPAAVPTAFVPLRPDSAPGADDAVIVAAAARAAMPSAGRGRPPNGRYRSDDNTATSAPGATHRLDRVR